MISSSYGEGNSLAGLGDALLAEGDLGAAEAAWRESVTVLDRLPHPLADEVRARLRALDAQDGHRSEDQGGAGQADAGHLTGAATSAR